VAHGAGSPRSGPCGRDRIVTTLTIRKVHIPLWVTILELDGLPITKGAVALCHPDTGEVTMLADPGGQGGGNQGGPRMVLTVAVTMLVNGRSGGCIAAVKEAVPPGVKGTPLALCRRVFHHAT